MSTFKLENLPGTNSSALTDLIVGAYYSSIKKEGAKWEKKNFKAALRKGRTKNAPKGFFDIFSENFERNFSGLTLQDFANFSGNSLAFWVGKNITNNTRFLIKIEAKVEKFETHYIVPFIFSNQIKPNYLITNLPRLVLIQNHTELERKLQEKYPAKSIYDWLSEKKGIPKETILSEFPNGISIRREREFYSRFGLGFEVFTRDLTHIETKKKADIVINYKSLYPIHLNLETIGNWPEKLFIRETDKFCLHPENKTNFFCPNEYCRFSTDRKDRYDRHINSCTNETEVVHKQQNMSSKNGGRKYLIENVTFRSFGKII